MSLPKNYAGQACGLARALEVVGERWTLLIVRDAFFGVTRFGDFAARLDIPRAVLAARLKALVEAEVMERSADPGGRARYTLTDKGEKLWPVVRDLMRWGDAFYSERGPRRILRHVTDDGLLEADGRCELCGEPVEPADVVQSPGPGLIAAARRTDPVSVALSHPHRLLEPLRG